MYPVTRLKFGESRQRGYAGAMPTAPCNDARVLARILEQAGRRALEFFQTVNTEYKRDGSEVTEADRQCSEIIVEALTRAFPSCAVVSEEGEAVAGSGPTWFVDPIDGTAAFLEGLSTWGPAISLVDGDEVLMGAVYLPRLGEHWFATRGGGAWRGDTRLTMLEPRPLTRRDSICIGSRFHRVGPLPWKGKVRCLGSSAIHLTQVAAGGSVATVIPFWEIWDVGAGCLMVEEVGGMVQDLHGTPLRLSSNGGGPFVAGHTDTLAQLQPLLHTLAEI